MGEKGNASEGAQKLEGGTQEQYKWEPGTKWDKPGWTDKTPEQLRDEGFPTSDVEEFVQEWVEEGKLTATEGSGFNQAFRYMSGYGR